MTNLPNDLSYLSDEGFNALCPQGEHAPGPEPLSPTALNVWCAFCRIVEDHGPPRLGLAAALRAAAIYSFCPVDRRILATIATELENHQ